MSGQVYCTARGSVNRARAKLPPPSRTAYNPVLIPLLADIAAAVAAIYL